MFELGAANQGAEVISLPELYSVIISVRVKTLTILFLAERFTLVYRFQCFSQRTKRGNHCFFRKRMAGVYHNSAYIRY
jgi:hypothetical protein